MIINKTAYDTLIAYYYEFGLSPFSPDPLRPNWPSDEFIQKQKEWLERRSCDMTYLIQAQSLFDDISYKLNIATLRHIVATYRHGDMPSFDDYLVQLAQAISNIRRLCAHIENITFEPKLMEIKLTDTNYNPTNADYVLFDGIEYIKIHF